ncbi:MAG: gliding motility-associated C-terminal domain-containing protein, partial [Bacteroidota bacterium]
TGGGQGPYVYNFNNTGFGPGNSLQNLPVTVVNVVAMDVNGCEVEQDIPVDELELGLVDGSRVATEPVCAGDANATITIELANGQPTYQYDFGLGDGFQNNNTLAGLPQGSYTVTARDADGCLGIFPVDIVDPPAIVLANQETDISCFGAGDGQIIVFSGGGRPGYSYNWSDGSTADTVRTGLEAGIYTVSLTDQNGCVRSLTDTIIEPNEIFPVLEESFDLTCFEEPTGAFRLSATGGTPGYTYSADGITFQADPLLENLFAGDYRLFVQDANGCLDSLAGTLNQPVEFIVDPGSDLRIVLGFDTILRAVSNYDPVSYTWGPDSLDCLDPLCTRVRAAPVLSTTYTVIGTNAAGCRDTAQVAVAVTEDRPLYIPNAFSPDGNGTNDGFTVFGGPAVDRINTLRVYDRWGGLVFERNDFMPNDPSLGWDGTVDGQPVNAAVFVYYASVRYINGSTLEFKGDVVVVR